METPSRFHSLLSPRDETLQLDDRVWVHGPMWLHTLLPWVAWSGDADELAGMWLETTPRVLKARGISDYHPVVKWKTQVLSTWGPIIDRGRSPEGLVVIHRPDEPFDLYIHVDDTCAPEPRIVRFLDSRERPTVEFSYDEAVTIEEPPETRVVKLAELVAREARVRRRSRTHS